MPVQLGVEETLLFNGAVAGAIGFDIEKALARQAAAAQQSASAAGPSVSPVVDETEDPQLRRTGPALTAEEAQKRQAALVDEVRKAIIRTSSYSAFDSISFKVEGVDKVVLLGWAMDPSVKSEIERRVSQIEAAEEVVNLVEVLPNSPGDDRIRARAYAAVYGHPALRRYAPGGGVTRLDTRNYLRDLQFGLRSAQITKGPHPIHILVKNGHLALVGAVGSELDKQVAEAQVQSLSGVFSVQNHLQVGS
jgi:osmotically-inducible protein OsmY